MRSDNSAALVLLLARTACSPDCIEKANAIVKAGVDWKKFLRTSVEHGVAPLIYKNICLVREVRPDIVELLKRAYLLSLRDSVRASHELRAIMEALEAEGIESAAIKGILIADEVFGDASLYPSSDIDILIREKDACRVAEIMRMKGYVSEVDTDPFFLDHYAEMSFFKEGCKVVEFHLRLGAKRYFEIPENFWWEGLRGRCYDGRLYKVLSPEKNLLFASLHLFGHGYTPLKFIVGIAEMLRSYEDQISWERVMEGAATAGIHEPLLLSLHLASTLLDAPLHPVVRERLDECSLKERWIFRKIERLVFRDAKLSVVMFWLTLLQYNVPEVLRRMMQWIFPSLNEISCRYNLPRDSKKVYCYYLLNPVLLLLKKRLM